MSGERVFVYSLQYGLVEGPGNGQEIQTHEEEHDNALTLLGSLTLLSLGSQCTPICYTLHLDKLSILILIKLVQYVYALVTGRL